MGLLVFTQTQHTRILSARSPMLRHDRPRTPVKYKVWLCSAAHADRAGCLAVVPRYEVQGEYVIPSSATIPRSAADVALGGQGAPRRALSPFESDTGRWRVQVQWHLFNKCLRIETMKPAAMDMLACQDGPSILPNHWHSARSASLWLMRSRRALGRR